MTYDPRQGSSPYLGMDASDDTSSEFGAAGSARDAQRGTQTPDMALNTPTIAAEPFRRVKPAQRPVSAAQAPASVPRTVRRESQPQPAAAPRQEQVIRRPVPAPSPQQPYRPARGTAVGRSRGGGVAQLLASLALRLAAFLMRLLALAFSAFVVASAVLTGSHRLALVKALNLTMWLVPPSMLGHLVYETPFGGALRGDLIIVSLILFVADYVCLRLAASLREQRERGV